LTRETASRHKLQHLLIKKLRGWLKTLELKRNLMSSKHWLLNTELMNKLLDLDLIYSTLIHNLTQRSIKLRKKSKTWEKFGTLRNNGIKSGLNSRTNNSQHSRSMTCQTTLSMKLKS
jgi:hypothetical protein